MKKKQKKQWSVAHLKNKLIWPIFSKYIRLSYADWRGNVACCTCGATVPWKRAQAGHFVPGRGNSILFDERNVHPQCYVCNIRLKGNPRKYEAFMRAKYGQDVINELDRNAGQPREFAYQELVDMYNHYREKVAGLLQHHG
jgi:hypothetical protein